MTDHLDSTSRKELINYKLDKALQTIKEAEVLAASCFYNAAVNRLYYAAYYVATALMLNDSLDTVTHKGVKTMLGLKFIHQGILEQKYGNIYQKLFDSRQAGDYEDFVYYDAETFNELKPLALEFIYGIKTFLESNSKE